MKCKKCGSTNVEVTAVTTVKTRGILRWLLWILLAICTAGLLLLIPMFTNKKYMRHYEALCQNCGRHWKV